MSDLPGASATPPPDGPVLGGFAYWRKNPLLASSMVPIVMTLAEGRLTATDQHGSVVFDGPAREVSGKLAAMGTFKLVVGGQKFALVGRGSLGGTESGFSDGQRQLLRDFHQRFDGAPGPTLKTWRDALTASGATIG